LISKITTKSKASRRIVWLKTKTLILGFLFLLRKTNLISYGQKVSFDDNGLLKASSKRLKKFMALDIGPFAIHPSIQNIIRETIRKESTWNEILMYLINKSNPSAVY
jgi:choline kinase